MKTFENSSTIGNAVSYPQPGWAEKKLLAKLKPLLNRSCGTLHLTMPSGFRCTLGENSPEADVKLHSFRPLIRLFAGGINGWSEGYIAGEWDSHNLTALVQWALAYEDELGQFAKAGFITQTLHNLYHWHHDNSKAGSRKNIAAHYDLGNHFYKHWLDESMTYSAALYSNPEQPLLDAQVNKYQRILEMLQPNTDDHILEIGCGWGAFALEAVKAGHRVHGVTLSKEQLKWAQQKATENRVNDRVHFSLTDYRDLHYRYDRVVSIEMFEAVGEAHWDTYFSTLKKVLKPGGSAVLQVISIEDERFQTYRKQADFIQRYIFPGGMLPSVSALQDKISEHGFKLEEMQLFGKDYAQTLRAWHDNFVSNWDEISKLGFDQRFYRLWRYYLAYCEGGFEQGTIDVGLYRITR